MTVSPDAIGDQGDGTTVPAPVADTQADKGQDWLAPSLSDTPAASDDAATDKGDDTEGDEPEDKGTDDAAGEDTPADDTPGPQLYKLPDGRELTADQLYKEHTENLLPEFTRKSQRLAELEGDPSKINNAPKDDSTKPVPKWKDPDWVPDSTEELIEAAAERLEEKQAAKAAAEKAAQDRVATEVENQLAEIRKQDPKVDESALFLHANKYEFNNLIKAYENMKEIKNAVVKTEQTVVKNLRGRENEPVAGQSGQGNDDDGIDYNEISSRGSGVINAVTDYLERKGK